MTTVPLDGASLTPATLAAIARNPGVRVEVDPRAHAAVQRCYAHVHTLVDRYEQAYAAAAARGVPLSADELRPILVYGVTTGFGEFKTIAVPPHELRKLQRNILLSHAVGFGENEDELDPANYCPGDVVRASIALRINAFLKGHSGVRTRLVELLIEMLHLGVVPLVPLRGSVGSSGDLCPLAHMFATLLGTGKFYTATSPDALRRGLLACPARDAAELPALLGIRADELNPAGGLELFPKEGLGLTNGACLSTAMLALAVHDAETLADTADAGAALTLEALCGRTRALDPEIHAARNMPGQIESARTIRALVTGSALVDRAAEVQDAYSLRCAPQVHGTSRDAIAYARDVATREMNAATDNPLFFPGHDPWDVAHARDQQDHEPGATHIAEQLAHEAAAFSAGNFHGQPVGMAADFLAIALAEIASIAERRTQALLDANHNRGLPANLVAAPGLNSGFMLAQYSSASLVSENKVFCHPASIDSIPTAANTEDHVAMATNAARKLRTVLANTRAVLANELLCAAQAVEWRVGDATARGGIQRPPRGPRQKWQAGGDTPSDQHLAEHVHAREETFERLFAASAPGRAIVAASLGLGTRAVYTLIRAHQGPLVRDEYLEPHTRAVRSLVASGEIARIVRETVKA